jgi:CBS domain-containing protein
MKIKEILGQKGREVVTAHSTDSVASAVQSLVEHGIGSLVVLDDQDHIAGILTERDILRLTNRNPSALASTPVDEVMTRDLIVAVPSDDVHYVMDVMTRNRVRHLPVVEDDTLLGIVSIGDVVNVLRRNAEAENRYLKDYVRGLVR